ncbi:F-box/kelch-repeat protein At3g23880-like [Lycium ferocissimum]|uniref:F-box/kelch-repeat protein At3g23880-like n=1 Tax=Lycium ferocissimum TaxID=112874 RepID=UPI00281519B6|nr:F-box/kelch-repeat protein At3g23880-like [Lycium ferocissimum]
MATSMQDSSRLSIPNLPPELINEILLRLPVKSLLRLTCVSKSWLALISNHAFIKTHLRLSANNENNSHHKLMLRYNQPKYPLKGCSFRSLIYESVTEASDLDCLVKNGHSLRIVGSVNGLVFLSSGAKELLLWNPAIRKYKKFPDYKPRLKSTIRCVTYGFGYDEFRDDYKVVGIFRLYEYDSLDHVEVGIYSLSSDSWRSKDAFPGKMRFVYPSKLLYGKVHWATTAGIISIDMADEKWGKIEQPSCVERGFTFKIGVLGNDLSVLCYDHTCANVWVMEEYGVKESWTRMYTIKFRFDIERYGLVRSFFMSNKGEILLVFGSTLMIYDPKGDSIKYAKVTNFGSCNGSEIYLESLVCPMSKKE